MGRVLITNCDILITSYCQLQLKEHIFLKMLFNEIISVKTGNQLDD